MSKSIVFRLFSRYSVFRRAGSVPLLGALGYFSGLLTASAEEAFQQLDDSKFEVENGPIFDHLNRRRAVNCR